MENVNRLLLENVLPAHVAAHFIGDKAAEVCEEQGVCGRAAPCWQVWAIGLSLGYPERSLGVKAGWQANQGSVATRGCGLWQNIMRFKHAVLRCPHLCEVHVAEPFRGRRQAP